MREKNARFGKPIEHPNFCEKKKIQNKKLPQEQENERRKLHIDQRLKHVFIYE